LSIASASSSKEEDDAVPEAHVSGEEEEEEEEEAIPTVWKGGLLRLPDRPVALERRPIIRPDRKR